jgi:hypothetical protein
VIANYCTVYLISCRCMTYYTVLQSPKSHSTYKSVIVRNIIKRFVDCVVIGSLFDPF